MSADAARGMSAIVRVQLARIVEVAARAQADGLAWLTEAERQRLQAISVAARRDSFLAGHWQARQLAARWLQLDAGRIALDAHADGRPLLRVDGGPAPLHVSLSHSGEWLALALAQTPVGIDLELPQRERERDWLALARFVFSPEERQRLHEAEGAARADVFHVLWALKEARGKRGGEGLQPRAARGFSACSCVQAQAEAVSWGFGNGALALALQPGTRVELDAAAIGETLRAPLYWRYRQQQAQEIGDNSESR